MAAAEALMDTPPKLDPLTETALRSMHDIVLPAPVSWMPQTWGWAALAALTGLALAICLALALRRYHRNAYRREALQILAAIEQDLAKLETATRAPGQVAKLLKRTALAAWPREKVAPRTGEDWIAFLEASGDKTMGRALSHLIRETEYRSAINAPTLSSKEANEIVRDARHWIERHHVPG